MKDVAPPADPDAADSAEELSPGLIKFIEALAEAQARLDFAAELRRCAARPEQGGT